MRARTPRRGRRSAAMRTVRPPRRQLEIVCETVGIAYDPCQPWFYDCRASPHLVAVERGRSRAASRGANHRPCSTEIIDLQCRPPHAVALHSERDITGGSPEVNDTAIEDAIPQHAPSHHHVTNSVGHRQVARCPRGPDDSRDDCSNSVQISLRWILQGGRPRSGPLADPKVERPRRVLVARVRDLGAAFFVLPLRPSPDVVVPRGWSGPNHRLPPYCSSGLIRPWQQDER